MLAYDQDAVVTREIGTFQYENTQPSISIPNTWDEYPLLMWVLLLLSAAIGILSVWRIALERRFKSEQNR
jgi:hypothetical protein